MPGRQHERGPRGAAGVQDPGRGALNHPGLGRRQPAGHDPVRDKSPGERRGQARPAGLLAAGGQDPADPGPRGPAAGRQQAADPATAAADSPEQGGGGEPGVGDGQPGVQHRAAAHDGAQADLHRRSRQAGHHAFGVPVSHLLSTHHAEAPMQHSVLIS